MAEILGPMPIADPEPTITERKTTKSLADFSLSTKLSFLLAVIAFAVYANTLQNGYAYDDSVVIQNNKFIAQGFSGIPQLMVTPHMLGSYVEPNDTYRPLSLVMFAAEHQFFGPNPTVGHFFNIVIFALCVVLIFTFLDKLFEGKKTVIGFIAALLFAVHPIHTEVVANIKSRDELLCCFFAFLSLNLFINYMRRGNVAPLLLGALCLYLSYLSKETVIAFLGIIPLIFFFYVNDNKRRAAIVTGSTIAVTLGFLAVWSFVLNKYHTSKPAPHDFIENALLLAPDRVSYWATIVVALGKYLLLLLIPYPLLCNYSFNSIPIASASSVTMWISLVAYAAIITIAVIRWIKDRKDPWAFAIIFYLATIFLFSNIPFLISGQFAERFVFFGSMGFCLAIALAMENWILKPGVKDVTIMKNKGTIGILVLFVLTFSTLTIARNAYWKNNYTLLKKDVEKSPNDMRLRHQLAITSYVMSKSEADSLERRRLQDESILHSKKALEICPGFGMACIQIATVYSDKHMFDSAELYYLKAIALSPLDATAVNNLALMYYDAGKYGQSAVYFKKAASLNPQTDFMYFNLAKAYIKLNEVDSAIKYGRKTLEISPGYVPAHRLIAEAFKLQGNPDAAEYHYQAISKMAPNDPVAANELGKFYLSVKKYNQAIDQFNKAISLKWDYAEAYSNLGIALFECNRLVDALSAFKKEIEIDPHERNDFSYIAIAYQKLGRMEQAAKFEAEVQKKDPSFRLEK